MGERYADMVELSESSCRRFAGRPLFGTKRGSEWVWTRYDELQRLVDDFRGGLATLGVGRGDRVAIVANNRVEWAVAAYATYGLEATFVPMYEAQLPEEWEFILADCGASVVIGSSARVVAALEAMQPRLPSLEHVVGLELPEGDPAGYAELCRRGRERPVASRRPDPHSIAGLIYTSGTTGKPKGVMLSHDNLASNVAASTEVFPLEPDDRTLSFLPWAHVYGQVVELHILVSVGASTAINDDLARLVPNLAEVRPTILVAVPRIFNRIYQGVTEQMTGKPAFIRRLFEEGVALAVRRGRGEPLGLGERIKLASANALIFSKIRRRFGGRLRYAISASASLSLEVAELIDAIGIEVYEGYGLSETSPTVTSNRPGSRKLGSVGLPIPGVTLRIDESLGNAPGEGEIIVYGPNVMKGYLHRPEETAQVLRPDGGLRTGDLGTIDADGFLHITGRIKEQYKLETGKYVMPTPLEEELKLSPYVANVMLHGANKAFNVALVVLNMDTVRGWAQKQGVTLGDDPTRSGAVRQLIGAEIESHSAHFRSFEKPKDFALTQDDFTTDNDLLTPTLKLKRRNVLARYGGVLESLYGAPAARTGT